MNERKSVPGYIIDTYAWVEYLRGSEIGKNIKSTIEIGGNWTPTIVLAELKKKYIEDAVPGFNGDLNFIKLKSKIVKLGEETAILAGEIRATTEIKGIGMVDCILLALAREKNVKVLTGDQHFKGLKEAEFIVENDRGRG